MPSRFYRPELATLTRKEKAFIDEELPEINFLLPDTDKPLMTRQIGLYDRDDGYQITYNFSSGIRNNKFPVKGAVKRLFHTTATGTYGQAGFSFRVLYAFLCEVYNGGEYFVDVYLEKVFKSRSVYREFARLYNNIGSEMNMYRIALYASAPLKADGTPDMRYGSSKRYAKFDVWKKEAIRARAKMVADEIRKDIVVCLSTGMIPLRKQAVSEETERKRRSLQGLNIKQFFFASGQLIEHLNIYVEVNEEASA